MAAGRERVGTLEDLHASATRLTGLDDFGDTEYLEGLSTLLAAYSEEAALTPEGNRATHALLRGALVARLFSERAWREHPEHAGVEIRQPIFVTGLPRTGTTVLHRLLTADPDHQGLELWLTEVPQPRPPRDTWHHNPVFTAIDAGVRRHRLQRPGFSGLHYLSAEQVEECWQLLRQSMMSISYECLAHLPTYSRWLSEQDWRPAYRRHRRNLQLIGLPEAGKRWVLKNPSHLFALDALLAVYPDALVIQTHREPRTAIASVCSLQAEATRGWSSRFCGDVLGRDQLELWARGLADFVSARERHDPARFMDVRYETLVTDPVGTAESVYRRFDLPLTGAAREAMRAAHTASLSGPQRPSHHYRLADVGLTPADVDSRFPPPPSPPR